MEEIIFRGLLFRLCAKIVGTWGALLVTAALFGAVHAANPELPSAVRWRLRSKPAFCWALLTPRRSGCGCLSACISDGTSPKARCLG